MATACPFCTLPADRIVWESELVVVIEDGFPVTRGHTLLIPKRHVGTYFEASPEEQAALWDAVAQTKMRLDATLRVGSMKHQNETRARRLLDTRRVVG